jgi:hypothetical protein
MLLGDMAIQRFDFWSQPYPLLQAGFGAFDDHSARTFFSLMIASMRLFQAQHIDFV